MANTTLYTGTLNCWSQSGSTKKYESSLGPFIQINSCGGLATSASGSIVKNWTSDSNCNYYGQITVNYSIPSGYSETSSSSGATSATISVTYSLGYGNTWPQNTVSKTVYYKKNGPSTYQIKVIWAVTGDYGIYYIDYSISYPSEVNVWNYISSFTTGVRVSYNTGSQFDDYQDFSLNVNSSTPNTKAWNEYNDDMASVHDVTIINSSGTSRTSTLYSCSSFYIQLYEVCQ